MPNFRPKDIIAILTISLITWMKILGMNGYLDTLFAFILGYYFVKRDSGVDSGI